MCAGGVLLVLDRHKYPACGPVDSYKQIVFSGYIGHPWQIFDIHVRVAWYVALECLQIAHTTVPQTPVQTRIRNSFTQKFPCKRKRIIQPREQGAQQVHQDSCLGRGKCRLQPVGGVCAVMNRTTHLLIVDRGWGNPIVTSEPAGAFRTGGDQSANHSGGAGLVVPGDQYGGDCTVTEI